LPRRRGGRFADSPARHPGSGWRAARQSLMATYTLDFEKPLLELEKQIEELKRVAGENADLAKNVRPLEDQLAKLRVEIYRNLTPMQRVQVARHPRRPYPLDYVNTVFTDFVELHGDRLYRHELTGNGVAPDAHHHGGDRRRRVRRCPRGGARRPRAHAGKLRLLGHLPGGMRRDPLERREPARARRRGAQDHGAGPPQARRDRRDRPG